MDSYRISPGRRRASASYTVEASYVMAIVIFSLALLIDTAYQRCREETGIMRLHQMVELARGQQEEKRISFEAAAGQGYGERKTDTAEGVIEGDQWRKEITAHVHQPEAFMRMMTIFRRENGGDEGYGSIE